MLDVGDTAPEFSLPGSHREMIDTFALWDYDDQIVVLAFYPMDFSPTCTEELAALREMELFSISDSVTLLAISADSAYAHRAFAREFDLDFPLLSDRTGAVASRYGVLADEIDGHENLPRRSVFVIDPSRTIQYAWMTEDPSVVPDPDEIQAAVESVTDDGIADGQFADARSKFHYGQSELDGGKTALDDGNYELAVRTFDEAVHYFDGAVDSFGLAYRYADDEGLENAAEIAERKTQRLRQAAAWYCDAAERYVDGEAALAEEIETDAAEAVDEANQFAAIDTLYTP